MSGLAAHDSSKAAALVPAQTGRDAPGYPPSDRELAARLRSATLRLARRLARTQLHGMTFAQLSALAAIVRGGSMRMGDVAAEEGITPATLSPLVGALERLGYVERVADPDDGRCLLAVATTAGRDVLDAVRAESTGLLDQRLAQLPSALRERLQEALPALEELARHG